MPHLDGRCRLIACDLIGMGRSEKLSPSGPDRYRWLFVWNTLSDAVVATQRGQFLTVELEVASRPSLSELLSRPESFSDYSRVKRFFDFAWISQPIA
jgi:hypothetical protein